MSIPPLLPIDPFGVPASQECDLLLEVELKFPVANPQQFMNDLQNRWHARADGVVQQEDTYFNHPTRDFASTDEAFRIRRTGDRCVLTYKGPKLGSTAKTREEIELQIFHDDDRADAFSSAVQMLTTLGFRQVRTVHKQRQSFQCQYRNHNIAVAVDTLPDVGTFVEFEMVVTEAERAVAETTIVEFAREFQLRDSERRSYLEIVLSLPPGPPPALT